MPNEVVLDIANSFAILGSFSDMEEQELEQLVQLRGGSLGSSPCERKNALGHRHSVGESLDAVESLE